jgi:hypothetical protein
VTSRGPRAFVLLLLVLGCARAEDAGVQAFARSVAAGQTEVDALLDRGQPDRARKVLQAIIAGAAGTHAKARSRSQRALLQDVYFQLARLALDDGQAAVAVQEASAGLSLGGGLGEDEDLFTANLLIARGAAHEALGASAAAVDDYSRAQIINQVLLRKALSTP